MACSGVLCRLLWVPPSPRLSDFWTGRYLAGDICATMRPQQHCLGQFRGAQRTQSMQACGCGCYVILTVVKSTLALPVLGTEPVERKCPAPRQTSAQGRKSHTAVPTIQLQK